MTAPVNHTPRLETPPTSGTDTDHSSEEYEAYEARYSYNLANSQNTAPNRSVTLPPARYDCNDQPALPAKRQPPALVNLEEEKHIKRLLSELNETNNCGQSTYKHRHTHTSSQDDINVTYSPERSFVYIPDSDSSDDDKLHPDVVRKPSIAKLKALFEKSNHRLDMPPSPQSRREITRSHSQRVTRSYASPFAGPQFYVPVTKSDSFNVFDKKTMPNVPRRVAHTRETQDIDPSFNTIGHSQEQMERSLLDLVRPPRKPELPMKQRNVTKPQAVDSNSKFYNDDHSIIAAQENDINRIRNRSNKFTSTGTRKPPVLPRKKFIGGRSLVPGAQPTAKSSEQTDVQSSSFENVEPRLTGNGTIKMVDHGADENMLEDEAERFHGSGGSIFYGPCDAHVGDESQSGSVDKCDDIQVSKKSPYTNVMPQAQKNLEQIQSVIEQSPRGAIIDLTSTVRKSVPISTLYCLESKSSTDSDSGSQTVAFDVVLPPKKPNKGYEPIWLGPGEKMSASSCANNTPATLIRENNYGRITPRCKSEEKLLESVNSAKPASGSAVGYGRIAHNKASSEPLSVVHTFNADVTGSSSTAQSSENYSSSDSSTSSSSKREDSAVPNLLVHSPLAHRKAPSADDGSAAHMQAIQRNPEFNVAVAEIRNLIDELMLDSSGASMPEPPKRERCHSLDLLCADQNESSDARRRRPSTDLLDDGKPPLESIEMKGHSNVGSKTCADSISKQTIHDIPTIQNIPPDLRVDDQKFSANRDENNDSVYYTAEEPKPSSKSSWTTSNWSDRIKIPPDIDYKALSSTMLRQANQRLYEDPIDHCLPEVPSHSSYIRKSKSNIKRSVSAREAQRPMVVKRNVEEQFRNNSATMRPSFEQPKPRKPHPLPSNENIIQDDGYVTLAETSCIRNGSNQLLDVRTDGHLVPEIPNKSSKLLDDCHQYATIQYSDYNQRSRVADRLSYRTLPQPPPVPPQEPLRPANPSGNEHIYSLPTLPKYRPPPPPPQKLSNPDLPTPPPSSEETSSSSSQGDTRTEPLYSQIQKPRKELPQFVLPENIVSTGYGHILTKSFNFSHDDLDLSDKPVAPPRKGRRQHKYSRHSLLDIESNKYNWNEGWF